MHSPHIGTKNGTFSCNSLHSYNKVTEMTSKKEYLEQLSRGDNRNEPNEPSGDTQETTPLSFKQEVLDPIPAMENPFNHDFYHMGAPFGKGIMLMYDHHADGVLNYFIIVDTLTGERIRFTRETKEGGADE
jgi:hypothetical protein